MKALLLTAHLERCTPLEPCDACKIASHLRSVLSPADFESIKASLKAAAGGKRLGPRALPKSVSRAELRKALKAVGYVLSDADWPHEAAPSGHITHLRKLSDFSFSRRTNNAIRRLGAVTIGDIERLDADAFSRIPNFGIKSRRELYEALAQVHHEPLGLRRACRFSKTDD